MTFLFFYYFGNIEEFWVAFANYIIRGGNMNYIDSNLRKYNQDKTIGIIICRKNNKYVIEYCSDSRIISREYELV